LNPQWLSRRSYDGVVPTPLLIGVDVADQFLIAVVAVAQEDANEGIQRRKAG